MQPVQSTTVEAQLCHKGSSQNPFLPACLTRCFRCVLECFSHVASSQPAWSQASPTGGINAVWVMPEARQAAAARFGSQRLDKQTVCRYVCLSSLCLSSLCSSSLCLSSLCLCFCVCVCVGGIGLFVAGLLARDRCRCCAFPVHLQDVAYPAK